VYRTDTRRLLLGAPVVVAVAIAAFAFHRPTARASRQPKTLADRDAVTDVVFVGTIASFRLDGEDSATLTFRVVDPIRPTLLPDQVAVVYPVPACGCIDHELMGQPVLLVRVSCGKVQCMGDWLGIAHE
jgi:hypothetical protein